MRRRGAMVVVAVGLGLASALLTRLPAPGLAMTVEPGAPGAPDRRVVVVRNRSEGARVLLAAEPSCKCVHVDEASLPHTLQPGSSVSLGVRLDLPVPKGVSPGINLKFDDPRRPSLFVPVEREGRP